MRLIPPVLGGKEPGCCLARTLRNALVGDHPAQGVGLPGHGESVLWPGDRKRCPTTAPFIQGQAHNAFEGEAVLGEAGHFEVGRNLAHGPFKKRQQGKDASW